MAASPDSALEREIIAREAELLGKPQRIEPLKPEEFDEQAVEMVMGLRASLGINAMDEIPQVFGVMLKHPGLFRCQMETGIEMLGKGTLNKRERELAILRVGWLCRAPFEWGQHVAIAKRYGIEAEAIERVTQGPSAEGWTEHEHAVISAVDELLDDQMISDETWEVLARSWGERQFLEFPMVVGQYFMTALQQNSLRIRLQDGNIGLRQR